MFNCSLKQGPPATQGTTTHLLLSESRLQEAVAAKENKGQGNGRPEK